MEIKKESRAIRSKEETKGQGGLNGMVHCGALMGVSMQKQIKDAINVIQCGPGPSHQEVLPRMPLLLLLLGTVVIGAALARSSIKS